MSHSKPLWLVQPCLDASVYRESLIGSIVKYPDMPSERHIPYRSKARPKDILADLDPAAVQVRNVEFWRSKIKDGHIKAAVNDIFKLMGELNNKETHSNKATVARMWHMDSPGEKFKTLLQNKEYFEEAFELLRENHGEGYFISDIVTFVNLEIANNKSSSKTGDISAQIPVDPSTGINVGGGTGIVVVKEDKFSASFEGELIVFVGYRRITLRKTKGFRAWLTRLFRGSYYGCVISPAGSYYGSDYVAEVEDRPVEGQTNFLSGGSAADFTEKPETEEEKLNAKIVEELGFDISIGGHTSSGATTDAPSSEAAPAS